jgi:hypothetical protein
MRAWETAFEPHGVVVAQAEADGVDVGEAVIEMVDEVDTVEQADCDGVIVCVDEIESEVLADRHDEVVKVEDDDAEKISTVADAISYIEGHLG